MSKLPEGYKVNPLAKSDWFLTTEEEDIRIDTYTNNTSNIDMCLTDEKTGVSVSGKGVSTYELRKRLLSELQIKITETEEATNAN